MTAIPLGWRLRATSSNLPGRRNLTPVLRRFRFREQPAHAVANGYFVGAINRVGTEKPWSIGEFYGKSYFCNPRGKIIAQASRTKDEVLVADLDLDMIQEVRKVWQFYRDRRPETYLALTTQTGQPARD